MKLKTQLILWFCLFSITIAIKENTRIIHYDLTGYWLPNRTYFFDLVKIGLYQAVMIFLGSFLCEDD